MIEQFGMLSFYEDDATMLFDPREEAIIGEAAIRKALVGVLTTKPVANHEKTHTIEAGDIDWTSKWSVIGTAKDGSAIAQCGIGSVILC